MLIIDSPLTGKEIDTIRKQYGDYVKITVDIENGIAAIGCDIHADGAAVLREKGSEPDALWGGGIDFATCEILTTAVLNVKPKWGNNSLEILDKDVRDKYTSVVRTLFYALWQN